MPGVSKSRVVWVGGRELPAGGIRASQGTFSSLAYKEWLREQKTVSYL